MGSVPYNIVDVGHSHWKWVSFSLFHDLFLRKHLPFMHPLNNHFHYNSRRLFSNFNSNAAATCKKSRSWHSAKLQRGGSRSHLSANFGMSADVTCSFGEHRAKANGMQVRDPQN